MRSIANLMSVLQITAVAVGLGATLGAQIPANGAGDVLFVEPTRRAPDAPPDQTPEVPPRAEQITPRLLVRVVVRTSIGGRSETTRQTMTRTNDRVHLVSGRKEWLFERNSLDGRRVSASLVDHRTKTIVFHDESDVRNMLGIRGWADVIAMGDGTSVASSTGTLRVIIEDKGSAIDRTLLQLPSSRLRDYKAVDLAEWLEER